MSRAVITESTDIVNLLASSAANNVGRIILDSEEFTGADGTLWQRIRAARTATLAEIATAASDATNVGLTYIASDDNDSLKFIPTVNEVRDIAIGKQILVYEPGTPDPIIYEIGTTEASKRTAFLAAVSGLFNGCKVQLPPLEEFVLPETNINGSQIVFDGHWCYFTAQNASQDHILRFTGNGSKYLNLAGDSVSVTSGFGKVFVATGSRILFDGVMVLGTSATGTAKNPIHTTGDQVTLQNIYTYQQNGGVLHDGGTISIRNAILDDYGGPHALTNNTTVANANISYINIKGQNLGRNPLSGFININSNIATDDRLGNILFETCEVSRPSEALNQTTTIATFKVSPSRSVALRNCSTNFGDFTGVATVTADSGTDLLTYSGDGTIYKLDDKVRLTGTLPAPLLTATDYWVVNPGVSNFQLAATLGGAPIDITSTGGSITVTRQDNTAGINFLVLSDGQGAAFTGTYDFDEFRIENSDFQGNISGGGLRTKQLVMEGSGFDVSRGLTGNWCQSMVADTTQINNCTFTGVKTHWFGYSSPYQQDFVISQTEFDSPSPSGVFNLTGLGDLTNYHITNVTLTNGCTWVAGSALHSGLIAAKRKGSYYEWDIDGAIGLASPNPTYASISGGNRAINANPAFSDYTWDGASWVEVYDLDTGGGGGGISVINKANGVAATINVINAYSSTANFGAFPSAAVDSFVAFCDLSNETIENYVSNAAGTGWVNVRDKNPSTVYTSTANLDKSTDTAYLSAGGGAVDLILPPASDFPDKKYCVKAINLTFAGTLTTTGGDTVEGAANYGFVSVNDSLIVQSDKVSDWKIIANNLSVAPTSEVVFKTTGQQSEINKINVYDLLADVGAPPAVVANSTYSTLYENVAPLTGTVLSSFVAIGGAWKQIGEPTKQTSIAMTAAQTDLDITDHADSIVVTSATVETITGIIGGYNGQHIRLHIGDANISVDSASGFVLDTIEGNYVAQAGGALFCFEMVGGVWYEVSRSIF